MYSLFGSSNDLNHIIKKRNLNDIFVSTFHDKFTFSEFVNIDIESEYKRIKTSSRDLYSPSEKLKKIHKFISGCILEYVNFNKNVVFSYRKGFNTLDAVKKHSSQNFFFQTDINKFFKSIDGKVIRKVLSNQMNNVPVSDIDNYKDLLFKLLIVDNQIPVGFSTSPSLSNMCLFNFDNELESYCVNNGLTYTRYSDDIIISSDVEAPLLKLENIITNLLSDYVGENVTLNKNKTRIQKKHQKAKLLGFVILPNSIVTIPRKDKNIVETLLHLFIYQSDKIDDYIFNKLKIVNKNGEQKSARELGIAKLTGKLIAINSMDKMYLSKLKRKYGNTVVDLFIRKSVK